MMMMRLLGLQSLFFFCSFRELNSSFFKMFDLIPDYVKHAPIYHIVVEALLLVWILWLLFRKSYNPDEKNKLTEKVRILI